MGQIRMTPETMRTRAGQTDKQAEAMQTLINQMDRLVNTLNTEWEGDAMKGFNERYQKIKPTFKNAHELLTEIAHNLRASAQIVEETDKQIQAQFRK